MKQINKSFVIRGVSQAVLLTFHNAYSMTEALVQMETEGIKIPAEEISELSPYRTRHVRRFGEFQVSEKATRTLDLNLRPIVTDELIRRNEGKVYS